MLYHFYDLHHAMVTPARLMAETLQHVFSHPLVPASYTRMGRAIAAGSEIFERVQPLTDVTVLQSGPASEGLQRDWPRLHVGVDKHYGYAFQWFALGALIALLYGWFQIAKRFIFPR